MIESPRINQRKTCHISMLEVRKLKRSFKNLEPQHYESKNFSSLSPVVAKTEESTEMNVGSSQLQRHNLITNVDADNQKTRKSKPTYLELVKASLKNDEGYKEFKINQSKACSA